MSGLTTEHDVLYFSVMPVQSIARQYDSFQSSMERMNKERKYLNFGFATRLLENFEDTQERLCLEVFEAARIQPADVIVDVGFGSGEQDFLLENNYDFSRLYGFNIAPRQVDYAFKRALREDLEQKLLFREGPAENMSSLEDNSIDKALAIECAFYFERPRFYAEAARVLKPGGRLVIADICLEDSLEFLTQSREDMRRMGTLAQNQANWEKYFTTREIRNITNFVLPGAQFAVLKVLSSLFTPIGLRDKWEWASIALFTQICTFGFLTGLFRYDLMILENKR